MKPSSPAIARLGVLNGPEQTATASKLSDDVAPPRETVTVQPRSSRRISVTSEPNAMLSARPNRAAYSRKYSRYCARV
ncbi:Uncharacterised protein [Mycobacteroides abscessus subsp. abscessus]|nr:Uncharacterised protein [Mycobacteroides abscessus subsp. abscessus]